MKNNLKNIIVTVTFAAFIAFFSVMCVVSYFNPVEISESERRPLAQFPEEITWEGIVDKTVIDDFEDYSIDQFPFREFFRTVKAKFVFNVMNLKENNGLAVEDGYIAKIEDEYNDALVDYSVGRLQYIFEQYLSGADDVYVSLVPDKNYFFADKYNYIAPDYEALIEKLKTSLPEAEYIDIFEALELEDYYRTDTHWSQDKLDGVVAVLGEKLGIADRLVSEYEKKTLDGPFYGVYYGQSALRPKPDTITYLTNDILESCTVFDYETNKTYGIYNFEAFNGKDGYDFFLSGTRALLRIDNPNATTDEELILFRDSYGSSLAPLLAEGYKSIYVVDIRYVAPQILGNFIEFEGRDVLFMYSPMILNQKAFK